MEDRASVIKCSVCKTNVVGNYCFNCGQKIGHGEITLFFLIKDFLNHVFSIEKSFIRFMYILIISPNTLIDNFANGHRNYYPSPGRFVFYLLLILGLHLAYVDSQILGIKIISNFEFSSIDFSFAIQPQFLFLLSLIPILSLISYIVFFRLKYSFSKHIISMLYLFSCFLILFTINSDIIYFVFDYKLDALQFIVFILLLSIWNTIVFVPKKKVTTIILYLLPQLIIFTIILVLFLIQSGSVLFD